MESEEARFARTLIAFRHHKIIFDHDNNDIKTEIQTRNGVKIESMTQINSRSPVQKIRTTVVDHASKLLKQGIRAYSIIISLIK